MKGINWNKGSFPCRKCGDWFDIKELIIEKPAQICKKCKQKELEE